MKKSILAATLAALMLLSGCSGVSQDEYDSLLEEKARLDAENSSLQSNNSKLESEKSKATNENTELQDKVKDLEKQNSENEALIKELQENNVPLEIVDVLVKTLAHSENEILDSKRSDDLQQYIYSDLSACHIYNIPTYFPAASIANVLKDQEETFNQIQDIGASSYVFLFKSYDKKNICCYWWANKKSGWVWFDNDVKEEYEKL